MIELLSKFNSGELIGLVAVVGGLLIGAIAIIVTQWRRVRVAEMEISLKQQMLEKGMSATEIVEVIRAAHEGWPASSMGNEALDKASLVQMMIDNGYEGEAIARVLEVYQTCANKPQEKPVENKI